jgi:phage baseplate assembly protein W
MKYRDLHIFFRKNPNNNDISLLSGNSAIVQSIKNLVLTKKGERPFDNSIGTSVVDFLFEQPTLAELAFLQNEIQTILEQAEPRIIVNSIELIYPTPSSTTDDLKINIKYVLNNEEILPTRQSLTLTVNQ